MKIILTEKRDTTRLQGLIYKIRSEVEAAGGLTSKQIDQLVRESRQRRKAALQFEQLKNILAE